MCVVSAIMDYGHTWPPHYWRHQQRVRDFEELMRKAKEFDTQHGEPDCELDEKQQALKKVAEEMGVEINFP